MLTEIPLPPAVPIYMVGTTIIRVIVYLIGIYAVARMVAFSKQRRTSALTIITLVLVGWTWLIIALGRQGLFRIDGQLTFPPAIALGVVVPIVVGYVAFLYWDSWRTIITAISQRWLISIQVFRLTGGMILVLHFRDLLPAVFAYPTALGDLFIGLTALPLAYLYARRKAGARQLVFAWNYLGVFEMLLVVFLGITTSPSQVQLFALDAPNLLTTAYPVVLFPLFSVPVGVVLHIYSLARLTRKTAGDAEQAAQSFAWRALLFFGVLGFLYALGFYIISPLVSDRPLGWQIHVELQRTFAAHPVGLYAHIIPSMVAILLGPFQFHRGLRNRRRGLHRWLGRFYLGGVLLGGLAGLYMAFFSFAGLAAQLGFGLLALAWLGSGAMAYSTIRQGNFEAHRAWMIRNYALTFAAVTLRLYTRTFIGLGYLAPDFHHINAWLCWVPNLIVAEYIIYRQQRQGSSQTMLMPNS